MLFRVRHNFGALNLKTGQLVTQEAPTFSDFIRYLLQSTRGKIFLILDNAKWHRSKELKEFFETNLYDLTTNPLVTF